MNFSDKIKNTELFLLDMDGTLYLGDHIYDFSAELLNVIKKTGRKYLFMTNNSSKSVLDYIKKLEKLGIKAGFDDFLTSSQATADYLKKTNYRKLYVCGTESLITELANSGFEITSELNEVDCIVMGFDTELTFKKLRDVSKLLCTNKDIPYIATNSDYVCPTEWGSVPDCGSVCDMLYNVSGRRPFFIGKPAAIMPELAMKITGISKEHTAVIGDRLYTDVKSGINAGALSVLVMSGETTYEMLEKSTYKPDVVLKSAEEILKILNS